MLTISCSSFGAEAATALPSKGVFSDAVPPMTFVRWMMRLASYTIRIELYASFFLGGMRCQETKSRHCRVLKCAVLLPNPGYFYNTTQYKACLEGSLQSLSRWL
jgi:hypothetical protein